MRPVFARGNSRTARLLLQLRKEALRDQELRVAQRFHAIALSLEGYTTTQSPRLSKCIALPFRCGLNTGTRARKWPAGRLSQWPPGRSEPKAAAEQLQDILDSGPVAYGLETGVWTSPVISRVIARGV